MTIAPSMIVPTWPAAIEHIGALSTQRAGGFSAAPYAAADGSGGLNLAQHVGDDAVAVERNRAALRGYLPAPPQWLNQVHGDAVFSVRDGRSSPGAAAPCADASIATDTGAVCAILTADCLPVLFCDPRGRFVGAAHAGWRGLAAGVLQNTVGAMRNAGADEIWAWLGPAIGPQCFEVGEDVRAAFIDRHPQAASAFIGHVSHPGKYFADLYALARLVLHCVGVGSVTGGDQCTVTQSNDYFSFRRDQRCGRMASLIWLR